MTSRPGKAVVEPDDIGMSEPRDGLFLGIVEEQVAAVFYWLPPARRWYWIPGGRWTDSYPLTHGPRQARAPEMFFLARAILCAYLNGLEPERASELTWSPGSD